MGARLTGLLGFNIIESDCLLIEYFSRAPPPQNLIKFFFCKIPFISKSHYNIVTFFYNSFFEYKIEKKMFSGKKMWCVQRRVTFDKFTCKYRVARGIITHGECIYTDSQVMLYIDCDLIPARWCHLIRVRARRVSCWRAVRAQQQKKKYKCVHPPDVQLHTHTHTQNNWKKRNIIIFTWTQQQNFYCE